MICGKPVICVTCTSDALATVGDGANAQNVKNMGHRKIVSPSAYPRAIQLAGGVPVLTSENSVQELAELCDGLLLTGGEDMNPKYLGEEKLNDSVKWDDIRDEYELQLFRAFREKGKPIFGICRGFQVINVALGGNLYQDLVEEMGVVHMNTEIRHAVNVKKDSLLGRLFGERFRVNSTHHQAVKRLGSGLIGTAYSVEGICESFQHESEPIFGTQFHPERLTNMLWDERTPDFAPLFEHFIKLCTKNH